MIIMYVVWFCSQRFGCHFRPNGMLRKPRGAVESCQSSSTTSSWSWNSAQDCKNPLQRQSLRSVYVGLPWCRCWVFFESGRLQKHKRSALDLWCFVHAPVYALWHDRWEVKRKEGCCESADKVHVTRWIARLIFDDLWWSLMIFVFCVFFRVCLTIPVSSCKKRSLQSVAMEAWLVTRTWAHFASLCLVQ